MALSEETLSGHMSSYKSACEKDPNLKSFDSALQEKTNKVVDSIAAQAETKSLSKHASHVEVYGYLLEVNKVVADSITESKDDVWENEDLRSLVIAYFENTSKTLEFLNTVEKCVNDAEISQLIIQSAVGHFDKESATKYVGGNKKKYEKTLEELKKLKGMRDHFKADNFMTQFELVKKDHVSLLEKVSELKKELDEKYRHLQKTSRVTNIVFGAVFACVAVLAVCSFAVGGALVLGALTITGAGVGVGLGLTLPAIAVAGIMRYNTLQKLENTLKKQKELSATMENSLEISKDATETIYLEVEELITKISLFLDAADIAVGEDQEDTDTERALHQIKKHIDAFTEKITELGANVDEHSKLIIDARLHVLEKISGSGKYGKR